MPGKKKKKTMTTGKKIKVTKRFIDVIDEKKGSTKRMLDEIEARNGTKIVVEITDNGDILKARHGKDNLEVFDETSDQLAGRLKLNGRPITYISPGAVIITEHNPICYTRRTRDGRTKTVCYPRK